MRRTLPWSAFSTRSGSDSAGTESLKSDAKDSGELVMGLIAKECSLIGPNKLYSSLLSPAREPRRLLKASRCLLSTGGSIGDIGAAEANGRPLRSLTAEVNVDEASSTKPSKLSKPVRWSAVTVGARYAATNKYFYDRK